MKKLLFILIKILILQGGFPIFANHEKNFTNLLVLDKKESTVWVNENETENDSTQNQKTNTENVADPDLTFNVGEPATPRYKPNGEIDYYSICKASATDLSLVPFTIYPVNPSPEYRYTIDWGDGSAVTTGNSGNIPFTHDYANSVGGDFWIIKYTITYQGIDYKANYNLYVGSSPLLDIPALTSVTSIKICTEVPLVIDLENRAINSSDTKYSYKFSDVTTPPVEFEFPDQLNHTFESTSCGKSFKSGTQEYLNAYGLTITAENKCGKKSIIIAPIYVSQPPEVSASGTDDIIKCVNEEFQINGIVVRGVSPSENSTQLGKCQQTGVSYWKFLDETSRDVTFDNNVLDLTFGAFGSDNGFTNTNVLDYFLRWTQGTPDIRVIFKKPGVYTAYLSAGNNCGINRIPQTIVINPSIEPVIKVEQSEMNCSYLKFKLSNDTDKSLLIKQEDILSAQGKPTAQAFTWEIYKDGNLIQSINQNYKNNQFTPEFIEGNYQGGNSSGSYQVRLKYTGNNCNSIVDIERFEVPGDTKIEIGNLDACLEGTSVVVNATAKIETYGINIDKYYWRITDAKGDTIYRSNDTTPSFSFNTLGKYTAFLDITTSCATTPAKKEFEIEPKPIILPVSDKVICEKQLVPKINFSVKDASQGVRWVNSNTIIGLIGSDTVPNGQEFISSFKALNPGNTPISATITVFPLNLGCQGEPISFKITVNPSKETAPHDSIVICAGDPIAPLKAVYNGVENNPAANYQWYSTDGVRDELITGATSWQFTPDNKNWGTFYYYCKITPRCDDPQQPCCDPFNSQNDTITILPKGIIKDTLITVAKSVNTYNLTPVNGVNQNVIPEGTKYKWTILSQGYGSIIGVTEHTNDLVDNIFQTFNLPDNFALPYDSIVYQVTAISGSCQTTYKLTVRVVPGITANVICNDIKCFGETGSIEIKDIFGIMNGNTIIRLLDKNNNDNIINEIFTTNNNHTFTNLAEGNYKISIFDENGVSIPYQVSCSLVEPSGLIFVENQTKAYDVKCKGDSNGEIYVKNTGGTGGYKYLWEKKDVITGNFVTYTKYTNPQELKNLSVGDYRLTVTDDNACTVVKEFTISEPSQLYFSVTGSPVLNCDDNPNKGGSIVVSSPGGGIVNPGSKYFFTWTKKNQTNESSKFDLAGINSVLSNIQEGTYIIGMYDDNGCYIQSPEIKIDRAPALVASVDSLLVFDCENHRIFKQYTVTSSGGVGNHTVKWFDGLTELAIGNSYVPDNLLNGKLITVRITDERACVFTLTVTPFTLHLPVFDFKTKKTACNKYQFEAISPENVLGIQHSFKWNFSGQDSGQGKATEYDLDNLQVNSAGEYYVELIVLDNFTPCEYPVVRKTFKKNFIPDMKISSTGTVETVNNKITVWYCEGDTISVFGENANAYSWSNGSNRDNIKINYEGQFTLWGKNADGCEGELNFETKYYKFGYDIVTDKDEINLGETVAFSTATFVPFTINYLWNFGDGTMNSTIELPYEHTYHFFSQDYFDILLTATNPKGCKEYATKRIKVNISSFPNTIMPGSIYEENRVFMKGCQVQIYNRNSVLIHEGADGWDGTHNGKPVMSDTYFYVLTYTQATGVQQTKKGYVTVIR